MTLSIINWGNDGVSDLKPSLLYATEFSLLTNYLLGGIEITPGVHYALNYEDTINSGDDELWFSITATYAF